MKHIKVFETTSALNTWKAAHSGVNPYAYFCIETGTTYYQNFVNNNGHDYVDLGLPSGTLWATMNVGAPGSSQLGGFYAWGETTTKSDYSWETYTFGTSDNLTKYNATDGKTTLDLVDDAAHVLWGGDWHIPSFAQIEEFCYYTNYNFDKTGEGAIGYESSINGNIMYFINGGPECGLMDGTRISMPYTRIFMSRNLGTNGYPYIMIDEGEGYGAYDYSPRCYGFQVRPVIGTLDEFKNQK